jgi:tetratricopeptide (TPR) repeat protein
MGKLQQMNAPLNEADGLRAYITTCERDVTAPTARNAAGIFTLLASAERTAAALAQGGADMRPEQVRIGSLHDRITRDAAKLVKLLGGTAAYAALRDSLAPISDAPTWRLDRLLAAQRARRLRAYSIAFVIVGFLASAGWLFRDTLLPPDPIGDIADAARATLEQSGDPRAALAQIDAGLVISPSSHLLLTWRSVLAAELGDAAAAGRAETQAADLVGRKDFLLERATLNVQLGRADAALADAEALVALDAQMPEAYYLRASGHELRGDIDAAVADLERCAALAEAQNNAPLFANARIRLGNLMQKIGY